MIENALAWLRSLLCIFDHDFVAVRRWDTRAHDGLGGFRNVYQCVRCGVES